MAEDDDEIFTNFNPGVSGLYQELPQEEDGHDLDQRMAYNARDRPMEGWERPGNAGSGVFRLSSSHKRKKYPLG